MKKSNDLKIVLVLLIGFIAQSSFCQSSNTIPKGDYYRTWIKHFSHSRINLGYLRGISKDTIILSNNLRVPISDVDNRKFPVDNIKSISFRKNNQTGKFVICGALSGLLGGAILGAALGDDPENCWILCYTATEKAVVYGLLGSGIGAVVGAIIGTKSIKIKIKGDKDILKNRQEEILKYKSGF